MGLLDKHKSYTFLVGKNKCFGIGLWEDMGLVKPVLYICSDNEHIKVASFNNWEAAELFIEKLKQCFGVHEEGGDV